METTETPTVARWQSLAACHDHPEPELWFTTSRVKTERAVAICAECPARIPCREEGRGMEWGVWGGQVKHRLKMKR